MKHARNAILSAATRLFAHKGYAASSIREICQAAGVTKPVLYYHFRSKEHLYQELMLDLFNQTRKDLLRISKMRGSLRERLILYVASQFRRSKSDPDNVRFLFRMMFAPEEGYPYFNYVEEFEHERRLIAGFLKDGIRTGELLLDPDFASTALMGVMLVQILEYLFTGRRTLTRRNAERVVDLFLPPSRGNSSLPSGIAARCQL